MGVNGCVSLAFADVSTEALLSVLVNGLDRINSIILRSLARFSIALPSLCTLHLLL